MSCAGGHGPSRETCNDQEERVRHHTTDHILYEYVQRIVLTQSLYSLVHLVLSPRDSEAVPQSRGAMIQDERERCTGYIPR